MPVNDIWNLWFVLSPGIGLLIGSFLNVCIYRLPKRETIVKGHSYCPACGHTLQALDLVPVFSYLFLRGRCRYCQAVISPRYMLIELWACLYTLIAVRAFYPLQPWTSLLISADQAQSPMVVWQALLLGYSMAFAFYIFLVWAMILKDKKRPPALLYSWLAIPILVRFFFQPAKMVNHVLLALSASLLIFLIAALKSKHVIKLKNRKLKSELLIHQVTGTLLMVLVGGFPVLVAGLAIVLVNHLFFKRHPKKQGNLQADLFHPLAAALFLLLSSIGWLFY